MKPKFRVKLLLCFGCAALSAYGQNITGSVVGDVSDSSGSVIPGTEITVLNQGTGVSTNVVVDQGGTYTVSNLPAGKYQIGARRSGFNSVVVRNIELLSSQTVRQNFTLQVGEVRETIRVSGEAPLVRTDTQTIGSSLGTRQLEDLPLPGRSIDGLLMLAAGATTSGADAQISGSSYYGGDNFTLNGVSVNDNANGRAGGSSGLPNLGESTMPAPDSLQEFTVDSGNQNAEYRNVATITMVLKQGTNAFHGGAYEFLQNTALNANGFLLNAAGKPRPPSHLNQFGADFGGPIKKNRLFVYGAYRGIRDQFSNTTNLTLPSMAMRNGDFSALCTVFSGGICVKGTQLYNPFTGVPFTNNQIPASQFTPQAKALLAYLPTPTNLTSAGLPNGGPNYIAPVPNITAVNGVSFRMDAQLSSSDSVFGVFHWSQGSPWLLSSGSYPADYGNNGNYGYSYYAVSMTENHLFSPTAVNEFRAAWVVDAQNHSGQNTDFNPQTLFPQLPIIDNGGLPTMNMTGYTGMFTDSGKGYPFPQYDIEIVDNFTKTHGRHTFKFGVDETGYKNYTRQGGQALTGLTAQPLGVFGFNGQWTGGKGWPGLPSSQGNAFSDFLLGTAATSNFAGSLTELQTTSRNVEFYAQDTFQATPKLTLNYGLRYTYQSPWVMRDNRASYLDLRTGKLALPQNSDTVTVPPLAIPELVAAYPFETTQQAGWPLSYFKPDKNNFGPRFGFAYRPFAGTKTVIRGGWGVFYDFARANSGAYTASFNPPWREGSTWSSQLPGHPTAPFLPDLTFQNPFPSSAQSGPPTNPFILMIGQNNVNPVTQQWSFTLEQQIGSSWMARASYIGAQTHHAISTREDINRPDMQQPNVPLQKQRPYQPWGEVDNTFSGGKVNFNQIQLELKKRFSSGLLVQAEYSLTHSLDNILFSSSETQNPNNHQADYGNSSNIPRQVLVVNYVYDLPVGRGAAFNISNRLLNGAIGGWSISGITTYSGGPPLSVNFTVPSNIVGWWGGRADLVPGSSIYGRQQSDSHDVINGVQWFNPAAFAPPQPWQWGNSERNIIFGPGRINWDIGLQKTFAIVEAHRLQVRADFLDAFNHFNLGAPSATIADTRDGGLPNVTAGKIFGGSGSRVIQFGLKYMF
jgi:hypothetical protein